ncbi:SpoVG family protein (plasmid) [Aneurinibacillus sp. Ricciae_BoGa-3]|uniref:SpoVG family protein n=1 Tax=Aneurinibacillus sp. Ricciae_BoGa-3 TaxID=3022697 RepID=UPI002341C60A|nr:SpoVG family protein [Aneurinibacillus sp. Ricciae_BoGa-3]WCK57198.1 SpoVG family protein [Aneurinibacillus sp. Ricciae_BoGa-3]
MKISEVRLTKTDGEGTLKAYASVTFDGAFAVHGVRIIEGKNGVFVSMPNRQVNGEYKDIAHPVTKEFKQELTDAVLAEFNK